MNLFHKLMNIKTEAVWHTIMKERADVWLNAIINILVRSALNASAGKGTNEIIVEMSELNSEVNKGLESPLSNYLSRKRPSRECMDINLFHKLMNIKSKAVWHMIMKK